MSRGPPGDRGRGRGRGRGYIGRGRGGGFSRGGSRGGGGFMGRMPPPPPAFVSTPFCDLHGVDAVLRTSHTSANFGRKYFACPLGESFGSNRFHLWKWLDHYISSRPPPYRYPVSLELRSAERVLVPLSVQPTHFGPTPSPVISRALIDLEQICLREFQGVEWRPPEALSSGQLSRFVELPLSCVARLLQRVQRHPQLSRWIRIVPVPKHLVNLMTIYRPFDSDLALQHYHDGTLDRTRLPSKIFEQLRDFQKVGLMYGVDRKGRFLLCDEMGLGKTLQALAVACYFSTDWPLFVICPASLRVNWAEEIEDWVLQSGDFRIIDKETQEERIPLVRIVWNRRTKFCEDMNIVSYDLARSLAKSIHGYPTRFLIVDESHYLKNLDSQRSKILVPLIQSSTRCVLVTGTPALSRPKEFYPQLNAILGGRGSICSNCWASFEFWSSRYCDGHDQSGIYQDNGNSHLIELNVLLNSTVVIRRLKKEVVTQIPDKRRQVVYVSVDWNAEDSLKQRMALVNRLSEEANFEMSLREKMSKRGKKKSQFLTMYRVTGVAKLPAVCAYVERKIRDGDRFLIYAHHRMVLDGIEDSVRDLGVRYIRIDGKTAAEVRQARANLFRNEMNVRVAILSLTACGVGLTLTPCSHVVFAELRWTPGALQQAEDRVHRIGQTVPVEIFYLLGRGTLDDTMWKMIRSKIDVVGDALDLEQQHRVGRRDFCGSQATPNSGTILDYLPKRRAREAPRKSSDDVEDVDDVEEVDGPSAPSVATVETIPKFNEDDVFDLSRNVDVSEDAERDYRREKIARETVIDDPIAGNMDERLRRAMIVIQAQQQGIEASVYLPELGFKASPVSDGVYLGKRRLSLSIPHPTEPPRQVRKTMTDQRDVHSGVSVNSTPASSRSSSALSSQDTHHRSSAAVVSAEAMSQAQAQAAPLIRSQHLQPRPPPPPPPPPQRQSRPVPRQPLPARVPVQPLQQRAAPVLGRPPVPPQTLALSRQVTSSRSHANQSRPPPFPPGPTRRFPPLLQHPSIQAEAHATPAPFHASRLPPPPPPPPPHHHHQQHTFPQHARGPVHEEQKRSVPPPPPPAPSAPPAVQTTNPFAARFLKTKTPQNSRRRSFSSSDFDF